MSRRHTSILGASLALAFALTAILPTAVAAQGRNISDSDVEHLWQLLTYVDADGQERDVPPGVGATMQLFYGTASGEAACSTYESRYTRSQDTVFIDPELHGQTVRMGW